MCSCVSFNQWRHKVDIAILSSNFHIKSNWIFQLTSWPVPDFWYFMAMWMDCILNQAYWIPNALTASVPHLYLGIRPFPTKNKCVVGTLDPTCVAVGHGYIYNAMPPIPAKPRRNASSGQRWAFGWSFCWHQQFYTVARSCAQRNGASGSYDWPSLSHFQGSISLEIDGTASRPPLCRYRGANRGLAGECNISG